MTMLKAQCNACYGKPAVSHVQFATFMFFAGCVTVMTLCVGFLLPECKGIPIEEVRHYI